MASADDRRSSIRLRIDKGIVVLRYGGVPSLACTLIDISEGGLKCEAPLDRLDALTRESWTRILAPARPLNVEVSTPHLNRMIIDAEVRHVARISGGVNLGLGFRHLFPEQEEQVRRAVLETATAKIRGAAKSTASLSRPASAPADPVDNLNSNADLAVQLPADSPTIPPATPFTPDPTPVELDAFIPASHNHQPTDPFRGKKIGEVLVRMGKLTTRQIESAVENARRSGERLGRYLLRQNLITPTELCRGLALQSGLPMTDLRDTELSNALFQIFPLTLMKRYEFLPFDSSKHLICIAASNPLPPSALTELEEIAGSRIEVFLSQEDLVLQLLDERTQQDTRDKRQHERILVTTPVTFRFCNRLGAPTDELIYDGYTTDIGNGGFMIHGPSVKIDQPDDLLRRGWCTMIAIPFRGRDLQALCSIRYIKVTTEDGEHPWVFGLQIVDMSAEHRSMLRELCREAQHGG